MVQSISSLFIHQFIYLSRYLLMVYLMISISSLFIHQFIYFSQYLFMVYLLIYSISSLFIHQLIYLHVSIPKATPFSDMLSTHNLESIDAGEETGGSLMEAFTPELRYRF